MTDISELRSFAEECLRHLPPPGLPQSEDETAAMVQEFQLLRMTLELLGEELSRNQAALHQAREEYRMLFELAPVGYLVIGPGGTIEGANRAAHRFMGRDQLLGKRLSSLMSRDSGNRLEELVEGMDSHVGRHALDVELLLGDSKEVTAHVVCDRMELEERRTLVTVWSGCMRDGAGEVRGHAPTLVPTSRHEAERSPAPSRLDAAGTMLDPAGGAREGGSPQREGGSPKRKGGVAVMRDSGRGVLAATRMAPPVEDIEDVEGIEDSLNVEQGELITRPQLRLAPQIEDGTTEEVLMQLGTTTDATPAPASEPVRVSAILLVLAETTDSAVTTRHLSGAGYRVHVASDARSAGRILQQERIDAVLADLALPGISGQDLARFVRARMPHVAVSLLAPEGAVEDPMAASPAGVGLLRQPCAASALLQHVSQMLSPAS